MESHPRQPQQGPQRENWGITSHDPSNQACISLHFPKLANLTVYSSPSPSAPGFDPRGAGSSRVPRTAPRAHLTSPNWALPTAKPPTLPRQAALPAPPLTMYPRWPFSPGSPGSPQGPCTQTGIESTNMLPHPESSPSLAEAELGRTMRNTQRQPWEGQSRRIHIPRHTCHPARLRRVSGQGRFGGSNGSGSPLLWHPTGGQDEAFCLCFLCFMALPCLQRPARVGSITQQSQGLCGHGAADPPAWGWPHTSTTSAVLWLGFVPLGGIHMVPSQTRGQEPDALGKISQHCSAGRDRGAGAVSANETQGVRYQTSSGFRWEADKKTIRLL